MKLRSTASEWAQTLLKGSERSSDAWNVLEDDQCVDDELEERFLLDLGSRQCPSNSDLAYAEIIEIVSSDKQFYLLTGEPVPAAHFRELLRIDRLMNIRYRVPAVLDETGLSDAELLEMDLEDLRVLVGRMVTRGVSLGNSLGLVWATDRSFLADQDFDDSRTLLARLGVAVSKSDRYAMTCTYRREDIDEPLAVPRCFDGMAVEAFALENDCEAPWGRTRSLCEAEGLPEAVHGKCIVRPINYQVVTIS